MTINSKCLAILPIISTSSLLGTSRRRPCGGYHKLNCRVADDLCLNGEEHSLVHIAILTFTFFIIIICGNYLEDRQMPRPTSYFYGCVLCKNTSPTMIGLWLIQSGNVAPKGYCLLKGVGTRIIACNSGNLEAVATHTGIAKQHFPE